MTGRPAYVERRYAALAERWRMRGWKVPPLPEDGIKAANLVYLMVAKINGREPLRVKHSKRTAMIIEDAEERGKHNEHDARPSG